MAVHASHLSVSSCADDNNWNPIEWDRAAEELTWERVSATRPFSWPSLSFVVAVEYSKLRWVGGKGGGGGWQLLI